MSFFEWKEKYELGVESIDNDHKVLVKLIDDIFVAISKGEAHDIVHGIVNKLFDYARVHFKREEYYMETIDYPEQFKHESEHKAFATKVDTFVEKLDAGITNITIEVITFLRDWLINHIQQTDMKLGEELKKHENIL